MKKPMRVLVTRASHQAAEMVTRLESLGAEAVLAPMIEVVPPESWESFDQHAHSNPHWDWIVFTSVNAVHFTLERLHQLLGHHECVSQSKVACVGEQTAQALKKYGISIDLLPTHFQSEGVQEAFSYESIEGASIWMPQAQQARPFLQQALEKQGAHVAVSVVYQTQETSGNFEWLSQEILSQSLHWITFTSSSTVHSFMKKVSAEAFDLLKRSECPAIACIGKQTQATAESYGMCVKVVPQQQTVEGMLEAIQLSI